MNCQYIGYAHWVVSWTTSLLAVDSCQSEQTTKGELPCKNNTTKTANLQKGDTTLDEYRYLERHRRI